MMMGIRLCTPALADLITSKEEMETKEEKEHITIMMEPVAEEVMLAASVVFQTEVELVEEVLM